MSARERSFYHNVVGQSADGLSALHENLQRTRTRNNDADQCFMKARIVLHELHAGKMQARRKRDAVNAAVEGRIQTRLKRSCARIHRELFHAVDQNQTAAGLAAHHIRNVAARGLSQTFEIKDDFRLVVGVDEILEAMNLIFTKARTKLLISDVHQKSIGQVRDSA